MAPSTSNGSPWSLASRARRARLGDGAAMRENEVRRGFVRRKEERRAHQTVALLETSDHRVTPADRPEASTVDIERQRRERLTPSFRRIRARSVDLADDAAGFVLAEQDGSRRSPPL